jgi:biotin carboxylase
MKLLLIMRKGFGWHGYHIAALRQLGFQLHLLTEVADAAADSRFSSVTVIEPGQDFDLTVSQAVELGRRMSVEFALTFIETDIVVASTVNQHLGKPWARPEADRISRDKREQREFLAAANIPSASFAPVVSTSQAMQVAYRMGYPLIVKPTHAAFSRGVTLVQSNTELEQGMRVIQDLASSRAGNYFTGQEETIALLEEYLPGEEVTLDGIVIGGDFYLAGVINKMHMPGPYFEEDYYSLPFRTPDLEPELVSIASAIVTGLGLRHSLFNVELRQDRTGAFRVVEFSTRMSGGHNYYNLREVHGLDVVRLYAKSLLTDDHDAAWAGEIPRMPGRRAACITYAYRTGLVVCNRAGEAAHSPYFQSYIPLAGPGDRLARAPKAYDIAGALNVVGPYRSSLDVDRIEQVAANLDERLDLIVVSDPGGPDSIT